MCIVVPLKRTISLGLLFITSFFFVFMFMFHVYSISVFMHSNECVPNNLSHLLNTDPAFKL